MKQELYDLKSDESFTTFAFVSEGTKGSIEKLIHFSRFSNGIYNLGFGDRNDLNGDIDDKVVTDNGDSEKVLITVVKALYEFFEKFPDVKVYVTGSTPTRTRLYRMGISKNLARANADFEITGQTENGWEPYRKDKEYKAFMVQLKKAKFGT